MKMCLFIQNLLYRWKSRLIKRSRKQEALTCEEGLHVQAVCQFDRCVSGVGGQSWVCTVVEKQPDYW